MSRPPQVFKDFCTVLPLADALRPDLTERQRTLAALVVAQMFHISQAHPKMSQKNVERHAFRQVKKALQEG